MVVRIELFDLFWTGAKPRLAFIFAALRPFTTNLSSDPLCRCVSTGWGWRLWRRCIKMTAFLVKHHKLRGQRLTIVLVFLEGWGVCVCVHTVGWAKSREYFGDMSNILCLNLSSQFIARHQCLLELNPLKHFLVCVRCVGMLLQESVIFVPPWALASYLFALRRLLFLLLSIFA